MTKDLATMTRAELSMTENKGRVAWEEELMERIIFAFSKILEVYQAPNPLRERNDADMSQELAKMRLSDQYDPFKLAKKMLHDIIKDLQKALEGRKIWRRFATNAEFDPDNTAAQL